MCGEVLSRPELQGKDGGPQGNRTDEVYPPPETGPVSGRLRHALGDGHAHGVVSNREENSDAHLKLLLKDCDTEKRERERERAGSVGEALVSHHY